MPRIEGFGGTPAGPMTVSHVPLPTTPVVHRGRPEMPDRGVRMLSTEEFTPRQIAKANAIRRVRRGSRSSNGLGGGPHNVIPLETQERIAELYRGGMTLREVTAETGISQTTVLKYLRALGVQMRPRHFTRVQPMVITDTKTCANPTCGREFKRREGEQTGPWRSRQCCDRSCAGKVAAAKRDIAA